MYKLNKSTVDGEINGVWLGSTFIPLVEDNMDYQDYLKWVSKGNTPEPADDVEVTG
jgi:hypothetical protein